MVIVPAARSDRVERETLASPGDFERPAAWSTSQPFPVERLSTVPNAVTLIRTAAAIVIAGVGVAQANPWLLVAAYAAYWIGDMADGYLARRLKQETRVGAVFDIISDRACTSILCAGIVALAPPFAVVVVPFFASFMVLDTMLSLTFLYWPLRSPNYFGQVDRRVYLLNWSPPAKALNTAGVILLATAGLLWAAVVLVVLVATVKVWSLARVRSLLHDQAGAAR